MRPEHAARVANAVRDHLWSDLEVCPPSGGWRTVRGAVQRDWVEETMDGFVSRTGVIADAVHLDAADYQPSTAFALPGKAWWVRYRDELGVLCVKRLSEDLKPKPGGRFLWGPLAMPDREDVVP